MSTEPTDKRVRAYTAGAWIQRERMTKDAPLDAAALERMVASDVLVVPGSYDHVELVLDALQMPYTTVQPHQLAQLRLRPEQLLIVNCPGNLRREAIAHIRRFVDSGGSLFTTDWALRNVLEPAFPGLLRYNEKPTADCVVRIEVLDRSNPFLAGVMEEADDPIWWLEGSSYPIQILAPDRIQVLLSSNELAGRWGEAPVALLFRHGKGEVFHMISHYYLQRTETRTKRHAQPASFFAAEKGIVPSPEAMAAMADLTLGDVESASSSARFLANVIAKKKRGSVTTKN